MQISTSLFYTRAASRMNDLSDRATVLQTQISTGKKVMSPSDNAAASAKIAELDRKDAAGAVYKTNITLASSLLSQADSTLGSMTSQIQRAIELATQAANGTLTDSDRAIVAEELNSIAGALTGLANTTDVRGQPLFGTPEGTAAVTQNEDGSYSYATTNVSEIPIADGQSVQATESASRIFKVGDTDTLSIITGLADTLSQGGDVSEAVSTALTNLNAANTQVTTVRASLGARAARVELEGTLLTTATTDRAALRSDIEDVDVTSAITELQKTTTVLEAAQASFTKLSGLSLFDYLK